MLILSHVVVIQLYCVNKKMKVHPKRITTDPCEKHFGNARQCVGGSRTAMVTAQWGDADAKAGLAEKANYAAVGNNRCSEEYFPRYRKKF